jgi:hypothetical protein
MALFSLTEDLYLVHSWISLSFLLCVLCVFIFQLTMVTDANSVHERVTRLCEKILKQHTATHPLQRRSSSAIVKDLRALSYGILLNKSHAACK